MPENVSGQHVGREYVQLLQSYLDIVDLLPSRGGKLNMTVIARETGVPRQSLYKNEQCKALLDAAAASNGLVGAEARGDAPPRPFDEQKTIFERRITLLEQANDSLLAENYELRRQLKRMRHIEELFEQGRRVMP